MILYHDISLIYLWSLYQASSLEPQRWCVLALLCCLAMDELAETAIGARMSDEESRRSRETEQGGGGGGA